MYVCDKLVDFFSHCSTNSNHILISGSIVSFICPYIKTLGNVINTWALCKQSSKAHIIPSVSNQLNITTVVMTCLHDMGYINIK